MIRRYGDDDNKEGKNEEPDMLMQKMLKTRTILLSGEINKALAEKVVKQLLLLEADGDDPIKVFIDSPGGDADAASGGSESKATAPGARKAARWQTKATEKAFADQLALNLGPVGSCSSTVYNDGGGVHESGMEAGRVGCGAGHGRMCEPGCS